MAKNNRGDRRNAEAQYNELDSAASAWRRINDAKARGQQYDEAALRYLEQQYQTIDRLEGKIEDIYDTWGDFTDEIEKSNKKISESLENFDDIDSSLISIGNRIGKNSALYQTQLDRTNQIKETMAGISSILTHFIK
jgi:chromosome segregation ATPase